MADENDTTITGGATRIVVPEGTVVSGSSIVYEYTLGGVPTPHVLTPAEIAEREMYDERRRQIEAWHKRNMVLLRLMLTPEQRDQFAEGHSFDVIGSQSKKTYRIHWGSQGNVRELNAEGQEVVSYCAQPEGVSVPETMLAQKLQLECDEPAFLDVANATCMATGDRMVTRATFRSWWGG